MLPRWAERGLAFICSPRSAGSRPTIRLRKNFAHKWRPLGPDLRRPLRSITERDGPQRGLDGSSGGLPRAPRVMRTHPTFTPGTSTLRGFPKRGPDERRCSWPEIGAQPLDWNCFHARRSAFISILSAHLLSRPPRPPTLRRRIARRTSEFRRSERDPFGAPISQSRMRGVHGSRGRRVAGRKGLATGSGDLAVHPQPPYPISTVFDGPTILTISGL